MNNDYASDPYVQTMLSNMPEKTGKALEKWFAILKTKNFEKHGQMLTFLKEEYGLTHGYANTIALLFRQNAEGGPPKDEDLIAAQYEKKPNLKPIFDKLIEQVQSFGPDVEIAPKISYVSLRRSKQFGIIQPSTKTRMDIGLNLTSDIKVRGSLIEGDRWSGMCTHRLEIQTVQEITTEIIEWLRKAYEMAG